MEKTPCSLMENINLFKTSTKCVSNLIINTDANFHRELNYLNKKYINDQNYRRIGKKTFEHAWPFERTPPGANWFGCESAVTTFPVDRP